MKAVEATVTSLVAELEPSADVVLSSVAQQLRERRAELHRRVQEMESRRAELFANARAMQHQYEEIRKSFELIKSRLGRRSTASEGLRRDPSAAEQTERLQLSKRFDGLSPRQREVLQAVIAGKANKAIAFELGVSQKTVETHRARVMDKLHVTSLVELVRLSLLAGIA